MSPQTLTALALAVLAAAPQVAANILSCADVACPITSGTTAATCTVVDRTFNAVGVASVESSSVKGLSWVKGVGAHTVNSTTRGFDQSFYLGAPDGFDFGDTGACALLFTKVSGSVKFASTDVTRSQGVCSDAIADSCISALVDRAKKVDFQGLSGTAACDKLQKDFSNNLDSACSSFAVGSQWTGIQAKALSGNGAAEPITAQQNKTSTCWPVLPKSDELTFVGSTNATGDFNASSLMDNFFGITPILTIFFPGNGSSGLVSQAEAQLTCVKTIDLTTASNATMSSDDVNHNAAVRLAGGSAVWAGLVSVVFANMLLA